MPVDGLRTVKDYGSAHEVITALMDPSSQANPQQSYDWVQENIDTKTSYPFDLFDEAHRLMVLKSYNLLDTDNHDPQYEEITKMAQTIFDCPIAMITIVDMGRLWLKDVQGIPGAIQVPRCGGLCAHAMQRQDQAGLLVVKDTLKDQRFQNYPLVVGGPKVRFYAAAPLITPEGERLGVLAIVDQKPRPNGLSLHEKEMLERMASMVVYNVIVNA